MMVNNFCHSLKSSMFLLNADSGLNFPGRIDIYILYFYILGKISLPNLPSILLADFLQYSRMKYWRKVRSLFVCFSPRYQLSKLWNIQLNINLKLRI